MALPIRGERIKLSRKDLVDYDEFERLGLERRAVEGVLGSIAQAFPRWNQLIDRSFLPEKLRAAYRELLVARGDRLRM